MRRSSSPERSRNCSRGTRAGVRPKAPECLRQSEQWQLLLAHNAGIIWSPDQRSHMTPANSTLPIGLYVRVSAQGDREDDRFHSPKEQADRARALVVAK